MPIIQEPDLRAERGDAPPPPRESATGVLLWFAGVVVAGVVTAWLWPSQQAEPVLAAAPVQQAPSAGEPPASIHGPAVAYPLAAPARPPLDEAGVLAALGDLLGSRSVTAFLQTDAFARRLVATIDNLGRAHAPAAAWPVLPTPGRFSVEEGTDGVVIAADNAARYTPFVQLVEALDVERTVDLYQRMYPLLQRAYRELGFGDRYLNDRVIEVMDLLLAAPEGAQSPALRLTQVKGPVTSTRPWVRYEFADPALEALAAGQKILVRVGPVNERRLKARLARLRSRILAAGAPAATSRFADPEAIAGR